MAITAASDCPTCGARLPAAKGSESVTCKYCETEVTTDQPADTSATFPNFCKRPIPCPGCEKKQLRPRIRTRDFRCQACSAIFPGKQIEDLCAAALPPPPKRPKLSPEQWQVVAHMVNDLLPNFGLTYQIQQSSIHPDDARDIIAQYQALKSVTLTPEDVERARDFYVDDIAEVPLPAEGLDSAGKTQKWGDLDLKAQAEAYAKHRNRVLAQSLAVRYLVTQALVERSRIPEPLASTLARSVLMSNREVDAQQAEKSRAKVRSVYDSVLASGKNGAPVDEEGIKFALEMTKSDPDAHRIVASYFQARRDLVAREGSNPTSTPESGDSSPASLRGGVIAVALTIAVVVVVAKFRGCF